MTDIPKHDNRCTAHTKDDEGGEHRCERPLGHPGLHRRTEAVMSYGKPIGPTRVWEFPDAHAWFPWHDMDRP